MTRLYAFFFSSLFIILIHMIYMPKISPWYINGWLKLSFLLHLPKPIKATTILQINCSLLLWLTVFLPHTTDVDTMTTWHILMPIFPSLFYEAKDNKREGKLVYIALMVFQFGLGNIAILLVELILHVMTVVRDYNLS